MIKESRFVNTGIVHYKTENGQHRGPYRMGGVEKAPKNPEHPFELLHAGAFKTNALKTEGVTDTSKTRQNQFALTAKSFQGPPTVKPAGAIGDGLQSLESKAFE
mmetsp:Transcript_2374/g.4076  ORF Transcript_2374/g.4076 Transcript_2374/m.4076 type:complete len:104 (-) Transcript_2374:249-560(-)